MNYTVVFTGGGEDQLRDGELRKPGDLLYDEADPEKKKRWEIVSIDHEARTLLAKPTRRKS